MYRPLLLVLIVLPDTDFLLPFIKIYLRISSLIAFLRIVIYFMAQQGGMLTFSRESANILGMVS